MLLSPAVGYEPTEIPSRLLASAISDDTFPETLAEVRLLGFRNHNDVRSPSWEDEAASHRVCYFRITKLSPVCSTRGFLFKQTYFSNVASTSQLPDVIFRHTVTTIAGN